MENLRAFDYRRSLASHSPIRRYIIWCLLGKLVVVGSRSASISLTAAKLRCFLFSMLPSEVHAPVHNSLDDGILHHSECRFLSLAMDLDGVCGLSSCQRTAYGAVSGG